MIDEMEIKMEKRNHISFLFIFIELVMSTT